MLLVSLGSLACAVITGMKRKLWIRIGAVLLAGLLLWWLFWAILIDEDENEQSLPETEQIE